MVLSALVQVLLPGGASRTRSDAAICASPSGSARMYLGVAILLSAKFFETMLSTPAWISFWRCNPHAPPFPCSSGSAFRTCPDDASHASNVTSPASVSLPVLALLLAGALTVFLTRVMTLPRRQASLSTRLHRSRKQARPPRTTLALLRSFISQAEFTSPSPSWRLMEG